MGVEDEIDTISRLSAPRVLAFVKEPLNGRVVAGESPGELVAVSACLISVIINVRCSPPAVAASCLLLRIRRISQSKAATAAKNNTHATTITAIIHGAKPLALLPLLLSVGEGDDPLVVEFFALSVEKHTSEKRAPSQEKLFMLLLWHSPTYESS